MLQSRECSLPYHKPQRNPDSQERYRYVTIVNAIIHPKPIVTKLQKSKVIDRASQKIQEDLVSLVIDDRYEKRTPEA